MPSARIINSILSKVALYSGSRIQSNFDTTPQNFDTTLVTAINRTKARWCS